MLLLWPGVVVVALLWWRRAVVFAWRPARPVVPLSIHTACPHSDRAQELFCDSPWALLISCILLNQTTRAQAMTTLSSCIPGVYQLPTQPHKILEHRRSSTWQVDPVLHALLTKYPQPAALAIADLTQLEDTLRPLGLYKRCARCCCTVYALRVGWG